MKTSDVTLTLAFAVGFMSGAAIGTVLLGGYAALELVKGATRRR